MTLTTVNATTYTNKTNGEESFSPPFIIYQYRLVNVNVNVNVISVNVSVNVNVNVSVYLIFLLFKALWYFFALS